MPPSKPKLITPAELKVLEDQGIYIGRKIGSGSFATVFMAEHQPKYRKRIQLACKLFDLASAPPQYREKFFPRELNILMQVSHPHIICLHSIQQIRSKVFIFMRFAENGDLLQYAQNYGPTEENQCRFWFKQIVSALQYLHHLNIAHRDLKCENILLSKNFNIKLADFGFARKCTDACGLRQLSLTFCGSAAYTAPEIIVGRPYNPIISDVWSLGVVLYILLNGRMPFDDSNLTQLLDKQVRKLWNFRKKIRLSLSNDVKTLVRRILEPDFTKRISLDAIAHHRWLTTIPQAGDQIS